MPCYHPWHNEDGVILKCGQCAGCRAALRREWSMRCMHEASMHEHNCFLTLTYDDEHLPKGGSLDRAAWPLFMKRLRHEIEPQRVRYFHVGEYGTRNNRPHYHALLFGWIPPDQELFTVRGGFPVFTSELLRSAWPNGLHEVGSVTPQSAGYVTTYIRKRITGSWAKAKYGDRVPEYGTMSRNPGIGASWVDKYGREVYPVDSCIMNGVKQKPPRYYDLRMKAGNPMLMEDVSWSRFCSRVRENETAERLKVMETVQLARESLTGGGSL